MSVAKKIMAVSKEIGHIEKGGFNQHFKFKFQAWEDVLPAVRNACLNNGLAILPSVTDVQVQGDRSIVKMDVRFEDAETGDHLTLQWAGEAKDAQDKGVQKAITSGFKYLLLKAFLIPSEEEETDAAPPIPEPPKELTPEDKVKAFHMTKDQGQALKDKTGLGKAELTAWVAARYDEGLREVSELMEVA